VNYNVAAGYTAVPTLHQLNPPKPDILVPPIVGPVVNGSANVPNGYNLVFINAKTGWAWPGDVIDYGGRGAERAVRPRHTDVQSAVDGRPRDAGAGDPNRRDRQLHLAHDDLRADHRQALDHRRLERQRWRYHRLDADRRRQRHRRNARRDGHQRQQPRVAVPRRCHRTGERLDHRGHLQQRQRAVEVPADDVLDRLLGRSRQHHQRHDRHDGLDLGHDHGLLGSGLDRRLLRRLDQRHQHRIRWQHRGPRPEPLDRLKYTTCFQAGAGTAIASSGTWTASQTNGAITASFGSGAAAVTPAVLMAPMRR
jgi:hypothetical protein